MRNRDELKVLDSRVVFEIGSVRCTFENIYEYLDSGTSMSPGIEKRYSRFVFADKKKEETVWELKIGDSFSIVLGPEQVRTSMSDRVPKGKQLIQLLNRACDVVEQFEIYIS